MDIPGLIFVRIDLCIADDLYDQYVLKAKRGAL